MDDKADFAGGQITALVALVRCLIKTHPDVKKLAELYEISFEAALATAIPISVREAYIDGLRETDKSLWLGIPPRG